MIATVSPFARFFRRTALFVQLPFGAACTQHPDGGANRMTGNAPIGAVARSAAEAWPTHPGVLPSLSSEELASACVVLARCGIGPLVAIPNDVGYCLGQFEWSAERAVPVSALMPGHERAEYAAECLLEAADCSAASECFHPRPDNAFYCEEDGCRAALDEAPNVTCDGSIATVRLSDATYTRDCAGAYASCSTESPTGCTDRLFTRCPDDDAGARCEGNIRIGCDSQRQVSYRDCSRLGGTCGEDSDGELRCLYEGQDAECTDGNVIFSHCEGGDIVGCAVGRRTVVPAPGLCDGA